LLVDGRSGSVQIITDPDPDPRGIKTYGKIVIFPEKEGKKIHIVQTHEGSYNHSLDRMEGNNH
jgi:hypothetical protein